jgi:hypothetical protein
LKAKKIIAILLMLTVFVQYYPANAASQTQTATRSTNTSGATLTFYINDDGTSSEIATVLGKTGVSSISGSILIYKNVNKKLELLHTYHIATNSRLLNVAKHYKFVQSGTYTCKLHVNVFKDNVPETVHMEAERTYTHHAG